MLHDYLLLAIKVDRPRKAAVLPHSRAESTFSFCWGKEKEGNYHLVLFLSCFSLLLILLLISFSFWKKNNSLTGGTRVLHFVATTVASKKIKKNGQNCQLTEYCRKIKQQQNSPKLELRCSFSLRTQILSPGVSKDRHQCHWAANSKDWGFTWRKV